MLQKVVRKITCTSYNIQINAISICKYFTCPLFFIIATQLADEFGNACNAVLRATACTYQALVLGIDCNTGLSLS